MSNAESGPKNIGKRLAILVPMTAQTVGQFAIGREAVNALQDLTSSVNPEVRSNSSLELGVLTGVALLNFIIIYAEHLKLRQLASDRKQSSQ